MLHIAFAFLLGVASLAQAQQLTLTQAGQFPLDANGFTVVYPTPSGGTCTAGTATATGSCIVYLDNTGGQGNDSTCAPQQTPFTSTPAAGTQCATALKAASLVRNNSTDFLMIKCGTTYTSGNPAVSSGAFSSFNKNGLSHTQPLVIDVYGGCAQPQFNITHYESGAAGLKTGGANFGNHLFIRGLNFYGVDQDPHFPANYAFSGGINGTRSTGIAIQSAGAVDVTLESNRFSYFGNCMEVDIGGLTGYLMRRNVINNCKIGIFTALITGYEQDENVFDTASWDSITSALTQVSYTSASPAVFTWPTNLFFSPGTINTFNSVTISGGSGYVTGSYPNVPLTGGAGTGAVATVTVNVSGVVSAVIVSNGGYNYATGDVLSASNANLGGSGSGVALTVSSLIALPIIQCPVGDPTHGIAANTNLFVKNYSGLTPGSTFNVSTSATGSPLLNTTGSGTISCFFIGDAGNSMLHNWYIHDNTPVSFLDGYSAYGNWSSNDISGGQWRNGGPQINNLTVLGGAGPQTANGFVPGRATSYYASNQNVITEMIAGGNTQSAGGRVGAGVQTVGSIPITLSVNGTPTAGDVLRMPFTCVSSAVFTCPSGFPATATYTAQAGDTTTAIAQAWSAAISKLTPWVAYGMVGSTQTLTYTNANPAVFTYPVALDFPLNQPFQCLTTQDGITADTTYEATSLNVGARTFQLTLVEATPGIPTSAAGSISCHWTNFSGGLGRGGKQSPNFIVFLNNFGPQNNTQIGVSASVSGAHTELVNIDFGDSGSVTIDHNLVFNYSNPATGGQSSQAPQPAIDYESVLGGSVITNDIGCSWGPSVPYKDNSTAVVTNVTAGGNYGSGVTPRITAGNAQAFFSIRGQGPVAISGVQAPFGYINGTHYVHYDPTSAGMDLLDLAGSAIGTFTSSPASTFTLASVAPNTLSGNTFGSGVGNSDCDTAVSIPAGVGSFANVTMGEYVNQIGLGGSCATQITGYLSGTTLNVSSTVSGAVAIGQSLKGPGTSPWSRVTAPLGGGQWTVSQTQTVGSIGSPIAMTACVTQDLVNLELKQSKANWNTMLRVPAINDWARTQFGMPLQGG